MICPRGHAFDAHSGGECPICGVSLNFEPTVQKLIITREELAVIRRGLKAAKILANLAVQYWPEAVEVQEQVAAATLRAERILDRNRWSGKNKPEQTCRHPTNRKVNVSQPRGTGVRKETNR